MQIDLSKEDVYPLIHRNGEWIVEILHWPSFGALTMFHFETQAAAEAFLLTGDSGVVEPETF